LWQRVVDQCPYATFFHTPAWSDIITGTSEWRDATLGWSLPGERIAVLPLMFRTRRSSLFREYRSVAPGVYGGLVCNGPMMPHETEAMWQRLLHWRSAGATIIGNPFGQSALPATARMSSTSSHVIDLRDGTEAVWTRMESTFRRRVRRAREKGVLVEMASRDTQMDEYYEVYRSALQRWGARATSNYPKSLFEHLWRTASAHRDAIRLWLAHCDGRVAAGAVVFYHGQHAVSWHAATREEDYAFSPANALQMAIIEDACRRNYRWYDLNPSGGHAGVARFKQGLGAIELAFETAYVPPGMLWSTCSSTWRVLQRAVGAR
jgi:CelD/BcsL family acetyltransferase involved in cellulose biosynthesis